MGDQTRLGQDLYELGLRLGAMGAVAIGSGGGPLARALARSAGVGVALAGGEARFHDGGCAACGAWLGQYYNLPATLFVRQDGEDLEVYLTDGQGRSFHRSLKPLSPGAAAVGEWDLFTGTDCAWAASRAGEYRGELGLERLGYEVADRPVPGAVLFRADREGLELIVEQGGVAFRPVGEDALEAAASFAREPQAVPAFRPDGGGTEQK